MKDKRLTVATAISRMNDILNIVGEPVMKKVSLTDSIIRPDDIILGIDLYKSLFYVCSPKQKLRVSNIIIINNRSIGRTFFYIDYIVDDSINVKAIRVADLAKFTESVGYTLDAVNIRLNSIKCFSGGNILNESNALTARLKDFLTSILCCMESDDTHTFEYIEMRHTALRRKIEFNEYGLVIRKGMRI